MRKELFVAICAGTLFGVLAAFGIWKANKNLDAQGISVTPTLPASITPTITKSQQKVSQTEIVTPQQNDIVFTNSTPLSGKSNPNAWVSISSDVEDSIVKTHEDGLFQQSVSLSSGINQIVVTTFDQDIPKEQSVMIVNSSAFPTQPDSKIKSYMGVITDKTENSLQIKDIRGLILLVSLDPKTVSVSRITDTTTKDATYADIGIGDSVAALGIVGASDVLDTKRILLTPIKQSTTRKALIGTITDVTKKAVTFKVTDGTEYSVSASKSLSITSGDTLEKITFADLTEGQKIIATGTIDGTDMTARRVQVIQ